MKRGAFLFALGVCLAACQGGDIAIFSVSQGGVGGTSGDAGADPSAGAMSAGAAGDATGGALSGAGGSVSGGGSGGTAGVAALPCTSNFDCDGGYFCSKQHCDDAQGSCEFSPFPNDALDLQVCGCDGVTYWNDSFRQRSGIAASTPGPCNSNPTCMRDQDCGPMHAYSCEHLLAQTEACGAPPSLGRCWVTPRSCPEATADGKQYQICAPLNGAGGGSPPPCVTKCEAIQSGRPFTELSHDQVCP